MVLGWLRKQYREYEKLTIAVIPMNLGLLLYGTD